MEIEKATLDNIKSKKQRQELAVLLAERAKWTRIRKDAEDNERACSETLAPLLESLNIRNIVAPDDLGSLKQFLLIRGVSAHINKMALINKGIDPSLVDECTDRKEYTSIQVRAVKEAI